MCDQEQTQWQKQKEKQLMNVNHKAKTNKKLLKAKNGKTEKKNRVSFGLSQTHVVRSQQSMRKSFKIGVFLGLVHFHYSINLKAW